MFWPGSKLAQEIAANGGGAGVCLCEIATSFQPVETLMFCFGRFFDLFLDVSVPAIVASQPTLQPLLNRFEIVVYLV